MKHFCLIFLRNFLPIYFYHWENFATGLSWLWQIRTCWIWWVGAKKVFRNLYHATEKTGGGPIALANTASSLSLELSHLDGMIQLEKCLITLVPVSMKGSLLCFRHLLKHLKENDAQSWVFLFNLPVQTSAIWVKVHIPDEVLPFGLCLTYLYWISNFHLPFCLPSHMIF